MKVAILHDYLNQNGGAERVLRVFLEIFPAADLFTLIYDKNKFPEFSKQIKKTSFLDMPLARKNHLPFVPFMPLAALFMKGIGEYDLVISSTNGYAKAFPVKAGFHISYYHAPLRYAWENKDFFNGPEKIITTPLSKILKFWDKKTSKNIDLFLTNSNFIKEKINKYYNREAEVVHPPVDENVFFYEPKEKKEDFYLMVGRLVSYKRFDLGINVFNRLNKNLKIIGCGPEEKKLKKIAGKNIKFLSNEPDNGLKTLYNRARALIFPQAEDFGIVAAEAQACGLPVIAYKSGGALEIVEDNKTGLFFEHQTENAIKKAISNFENKSFDRRYIAHSALRFSKSRFKDKIKETINRELINPHG